MAEYEACILGLKMAIDMNVHELLVIGDSDLLIHQVQGEWAVKNPKITPYVQYIQKLCKRFRKIEFKHTPRTQNELADALATIASMIKHPDTSFIDPLDIEVKEHPVYCSHVEAEPDGLPWYSEIKKYLETGTYPDNATFNQKKSIRRMTLNFFAIYGTEAVIPAEIEIPSLRIIQEAELNDSEWVRKRIDQLTLIDEKRMVA
ncbi:uncharacterized protein LOC125851492, partial [Solanum stenotomum]|uniref:uncharacterized protein LOC125851492 n=1 Tax=Solanum stenotomum TaxID=172797 RepID=UPI0020D04B3F